MLHFLRRLLAGTESKDNTTTQAPFLRTPAYMADVEDRLERHSGPRIERRNAQIPVFLANQFDRDAAAMRKARVADRRIETNTASLL